jgi:hypothetical protein
MQISDWLSPAATIIASIVAVGVTAHFARQQTAISREQARTAKEKLRHDLYEKRWAIFESIFDYYRAMITWERTTEQERAKERFFRSYQQSGFLFSKDVEELMKNLNDQGNVVTGLKDLMADADTRPTDPKTIADWSKRINDIQTRGFEEGFLKLKATIAPYLSFHRL